MRRFIRFAAGIYPTAWRKRYGAEFNALLEDVNPDWRTPLDILKGAVETQMRTWSLGRISAVTGIAGALIAVGISFAIPKQYASQAVLHVDGAANSSTADAVMALAQQAESRTSLTDIIESEGLYARERARIPIDNALDRMRKSVGITPVPGSRQPAFVIQFAYEDPAKAQRVTQDLVANFMRENVRRGAGQLTLRLLDPASLPKTQLSPNRAMITAIGLTGGLGLGVILALTLRRVSQKIA